MIPLFNDYEKIAPKWFAILKNDNIIPAQGGNSITSAQSCFVGEVYLYNDAYASAASSAYCEACRDYSMYFLDIMVEIASKLGIYKWSTPIGPTAKSNIKTELTIGKYDDGDGAKRGKELSKYLDTYSSEIGTYRDFFNAVANNYLQHLSGCPKYAENAAILRGVI